MKLSIKKTLVNNVYSAAIEIKEWSKEEEALVVQFGEPTVEIGGEILGESGDKVITLPTSTRKMKTQFPVSMKFSDATYKEDTKKIANAWVHTVQKRMEVVMESLRLKEDDFTGEEEVTI